MLTVEDYLDFVEQEYLADFVADGGCAVKFAIGSSEAGAALRSGLLARARALGYACATVDASTTRVHMIDRVFAQIAKQIDWQGGSRAIVRQVVADLGLRVPDGGDLSLDGLAVLNDYDVLELRRELNRALQREILDDHEMMQEFRRAALRLCQAEVEQSDVVRNERDAVVMWLEGELRLIGSLRSANIFQKVARHNARDMLLSLTRWLVKTGKKGLVLDLDVRRVSETARPADGTLFYTKSTAMDVYELLRQLIDSTDELSSCFALVSSAPELITDPKRGFEQNYIALKMRIAEDVRDQGRSNPLAALVRIADSDATSAAT